MGGMQQQQTTHALQHQISTFLHVLENREWYRDMILCERENRKVQSIYWYTSLRFINLHNYPPTLLSHAESGSDENKFNTKNLYQMHASDHR